MPETPLPVVLRLENGSPVLPRTPSVRPVISAPTSIGAPSAELVWNPTSVLGLLPVTVTWSKVAISAHPASMSPGERHLSPAMRGGGDAPVTPCRRGPVALGSLQSVLLGLGYQRVVALLTPKPSSLRLLLETHVP